MVSNVDQKAISTIYEIIKQNAQDFVELVVEATKRCFVSY